MWFTTISLESPSMMCGNTHLVSHISSTVPKLFCDDLRLEGLMVLQSSSKTIISTPSKCTFGSERSAHLVLKLSPAQD